MKTSSSLKRRVALVTGASSGLGRAAAMALAGEGVRVVVVSRELKDLEKTKRVIEKKGGSCLAVECDISNNDDVLHSMEEIKRRLKRLDIVFANAGINGVWAPIEQLDLAEWEQTIRINLTGTFLTIKHAVPLLAKRGGSVIVTSSVNGTRMFSHSGASAYATSKAGQVALSKMLALELARHQIRVNVICPGSIESKIEQSTERRDLDQLRSPIRFPNGSIPLKQGKPGTAAEVAKLVCFLASDAASHITGTEMYIDGGQSLMEG